MEHSGPKKKIQNIQALRGAAVLLVVLFHTGTIETKYSPVGSLLPDTLQFGMFGVDLFFVISGFVMVTVTRGKFQQPWQALTFLYHRISRIYPLYWFYSLLVLAVFLVQPSFVNSSQYGQVDLLASFLILPQEQRPLLMVGWTLVHEMYFYLIFFLLLFFPEKRLPAGIAFWTTTIILLRTFLPQVSSPGLAIVTHPLTLEFVGGCLLALRTGVAGSRLPAPVYLLAAGFALMAGWVAFLVHWHATGLVEPPGWWRILIMGLPAVLIVLCLIRAEQQSLVLPRSLSWVGDISYSVYLSHILTLSLIGRLWAAVVPDSTVDNLFLLPLLLAAVLVIGGLSSALIERPLLVLCKKII